MKKLVLSIFAVFILVSSCNQEQDLSPTNNFEEEISFLSEMNTNVLNLSVANLGKHLTSVGNDEIGLNQRQLLDDILSDMDGKYFNFNKESKLDFLSNYGNINLRNHLANAKNNGTVDLSGSQIFSEKQLMLVQPFIDDVSIEGDFNVIKSRAMLFQQSIVNSNLSYDEKIQLLVISTNAISFAEFVEDGGVDKIVKILHEIVNTTDASNRRIMGCDAGTIAKDAFMAGVLGGAALGIEGIKAGALATVAVNPIVGGIVGGVAGFTAGFVGSALLGGAASALWECVIQ